MLCEKCRRNSPKTVYSLARCRPTPRRGRSAVLGAPDRGRFGPSLRCAGTGSRGLLHALFDWEGTDVLRQLLQNRMKYWRQLTRLISLTRQNFVQDQDLPGQVRPMLLLHPDNGIGCRLCIPMPPGTVLRLCRATSAVRKWRERNVQQGQLQSQQLL